MSIKGWVYVISNKAMPGLVKVGFSMKDPLLRASEFDGTGNPHRYDVAYDALVLNPREIEQECHRHLSDCREGKEWFRCDISDAIRAIQLKAKSGIFLESVGSKTSAGVTLIEKAQARIADLEKQVAYLSAKEYRFINAINSDDTDWKKCVACYPNWPQQLLLQLFENDGDRELATPLAGNPGLAAECIAELVMESVSSDTLVAAVRNPNCDAQTLAQITWLSNFTLVAEAESHPNYSATVLDCLLHEKLNDADCSVRSWLAEFEKCPTDILRVLAVDTESSVRKAVASNPNCPLDTIYALIDDEDSDVIDAAMGNPSHPLNRIAKQGVDYGLVDIISDPRTPSAVLRDFINSPIWEYRQAAALNENCPQELLNDLSNDCEIRVRIAAKKRIKA